MDVNYQHQSLKEEIANSITHGIGLLLSISGLVLLVVFASLRGDAWHIVSFSIFGVGMIMVYTSSTLFHAFRNFKIKSILNIIDHSAVFILIAATYTPFTLVTIRGPWGWSIFGVVWLAAIAGIILKIFFIGKYRTLSTLLYVAIGWVLLIAIKPLYASLPTPGFWLLMSGCFTYSIGVVFYLWRRLPFGHSIWHLFVLGGTICHFFAVILYVL
ncbi:MAG: hemolysin III family protein [Bacteroidales bacterium]|nr:hemolysin III family protein [Bacteroidales bacterium]